MKIMRSWYITSISFLITPYVLLKLGHIVNVNHVYEFILRLLTVKMHSNTSNTVVINIDGSSISRSVLFGTYNTTSQEHIYF